MRYVLPLALLLAAGPAWADGTHMFHHDEGFAFGHPGQPDLATRSIAITMGDMDFTPARIEVRKGETVRLEIRNASSVDHDFTLGDEATQAAHRKAMASGHSHGHADANAVMVEAGKTQSLVWTFDRPGEIAYDCNVPGHFESGMAGKVVVK